MSRILIAGTDEQSADAVRHALGEGYEVTVVTDGWKAFEHLYEQPPDAVLTDLNLTGLTPGQTYYVVADGATSDVFGMGAYVLDVQFSGSTTASAPQAPSNLTATAISSSQVDLAWQDNSSNEDGFRIEKSTDGTNFTLLATVGANATGVDPAGVIYFGNSMITSPIGEVLARAASHEGWVSTRLDPATALRSLTPGSSVPQRFDHLADRNLDFIRAHLDELAAPARTSFPRRDEVG